VLKKLIEKTNVVLVVSQPDRAKDRKGNLLPTPTKQLAEENNIEVYQTNNIKQEYEYITSLNPDIIITCAYGQIIPSILLDTPKYKAINVHASLLPKLRGGSPLHKCLIDGYKETGVTIMYMAPGMDDGDMIKQRKIEILDHYNVGDIHDKLSIIGSELLLETLPSIFDGTNERIKQDESEVTFAYNIKKEEEKLDFTKTAREVHNHIRGLYPFPTSYTTLNGEILKICESRVGSKKSGECGKIVAIYDDGLGVMCSDSEIIISRLKPAGKKEMSAKDFINGRGKDKLLGEKLC
jgi:methionyl-tRNA formyltransferase